MTVEALSTADDMVESSAVQYRGLRQIRGEVTTIGDLSQPDCIRPGGRLRMEKPVVTIPVQPGLRGAVFQASLVDRETIGVLLLVKGGDQSRQT